MLTSFVRNVRTKTNGTVTQATTTTTNSMGRHKVQSNRMARKPRVHDVDGRHMKPVPVHTKKPLCRYGTCSKKGHLSSACRSKDNNKENFNFIDSNPNVNFIPDVNLESDGNSFDFSLYSVTDDESNERYWMKVVFGGTRMDIACDTGAVHICSEDFLRETFITVSTCEVQSTIQKLRRRKNKFNW